MARLILAICPSNQDGNKVLGGGNEMQHIQRLAAAIRANAGKHPAIAAWVAPSDPQSEDWSTGSLKGLRDQQRAARDWIVTTRQPGDLTVSLNLHSDSGLYRHCGYYYDSLSGPVSQWLGRALAESVKAYFSGKVLSADYSGYIFAGELRSVACPILLEMGSHQMAADVAAVRDHAGEIAEVLVGTLVGFFGLEAPRLNISELRTYGEWAMARCNLSEDPRELGAFGLHLAAIGADPSEPARYGVPGLV